MIVHPKMHQDDDDLEVLPNEGLISAMESNWWFFCSDKSRNERKRKLCNTYEESERPSNISKTLRRILTKYQACGLSNRALSHIECKNCHSQACVPCI